MALHLIIDGYNFIRQSQSLSRQEARGLGFGREALLARLASYRRIKPHPVTVVFDAAEGPIQRQTAEKTRGIKVVYSSARETADQVIIRLARRMGSQAVVVSSDQALCQAVEAAGATAVSSPEFEERMEQASCSDKKGVEEEEEDYQPSRSTRKKGPARRPSRAARRRKSRLSKI
ncbi:MAG: NYN domain-containing protein [Deltaproteobacteria bacterium]|nr:NYN domain-containing protein [Deltaproteobacteria bacterium]MBW2084852.1 NYN domain-containing protein [Deltaproteobacteria bacterium]